MDPIPFADIYAEINDMVKPASQPDGITLKDLTACGWSDRCADSLLTPGQGVEGP